MNFCGLRQEMRYCMLFVLLPKSLTLSWISWYIIRKCYHSNAMMLLLRFSTSTKGQGCFQIRQKCDDLSLKSLDIFKVQQGFTLNPMRENSIQSSWKIVTTSYQDGTSFLKMHILYSMRPLFKCIDRIQKRIENPVAKHCSTQF